MGHIRRGFHFLGLTYEPAQTAHHQPQRTRPKSSVAPKVGLHPRTFHRALEKIKALNTDATAVATTQAYLLRWSRWWAHVPALDHHTILKDLGEWFFDERLALQIIGWYFLDRCGSAGFEKS